MEKIDLGPNEFEDLDSYRNAPPEAGTQTYDLNAMHDMAYNFGDLTRDIPISMGVGEIPIGRDKEMDKKVKEVHLWDHVFPFENLVLEGGGAKGIAYAGVLKVRGNRFLQ